MTIISVTIWVDQQMLPEGTRQILIRTLTEIQGRVKYLASSVIQDDDEQSATELHSAAESIGRVIERLMSRVDAG